jgi:hypothetical protein
MLVVGIMGYRYFFDTNKSIISSTVIVRDTIYVEKKDTVFFEKSRKIVENKLVTVQQKKLVNLVDTTVVASRHPDNDSVAIELPIEQVIYTGASAVGDGNYTISYEVGVSGYKPNLDYLKYKLRTINEKETIVVTPKKKWINVKWGLFMGPAYGFNSKKIDFVVGGGLIIYF